jgi:excisionase family DNA binding protein
VTEPDKQPLTLTAAQAAALIGISDDAIYRALANGLPHIKVGTRGVIRIHREGLETWLRDVCARGDKI